MTLTVRHQHTATGTENVKQIRLQIKQMRQQQQRVYNYNNTVQQYKHLFKHRMECIKQQHYFMPLLFSLSHPLSISLTQAVMLALACSLTYAHANLLKKNK